MLITLIAWAYISFHCHTWGLFFVKSLDRSFHYSNPLSYGFSITCFIGLAAITCCLQILSFFTGLGGVVMQSVFCLTSLSMYFFVKSNSNLLKRIVYFIKNIHKVTLFLLAISLLMVLVMSVYAVSHPDTLAYHAQLVKWAAKYKTIPGLVNISYLYGLQSNWFLLCGFFSFSFTGTHAVTFINTTVILWLLIFFIQKISAAIKKPQGNYYAFLWLLLLSFNIWAYTQIRLTATSASPDFIAALYILLAAYLFSQYNSYTHESRLLIIFLCFFACTIKLSAAPIVLLACFLLFSKTSLKTYFFAVGLIAIVVIPFLVRNCIISGHLLFPSAFMDIFYADWKYDNNKLEYINQYISAFARVGVYPAPPEKIIQMSFSDWLPIWWHNRYTADKLLIIAQIPSVVVAVVNYKKIVALNKFRLILTLVSFAGIIFWFAKAPDPRFGTGFLLLFPSLILTSEPVAEKGMKFITSASRIAIATCVLLCFCISCYTVYRFTNYFKAADFVYPEGITVAVTSVYYDEIKTCIPLFNANENNFVIKTDSAKSRNFNFRGNTVEDGFSGKK